MSIQLKRKESMYFRIVSNVISNELTNVNISYPTVTEVKLSKDSSVLTIYVTFEKNKEKSFEAIQNTKGFIKSEIARVGNQRIIPNILFKLDKTQEFAQKIEKILKKF